LGSGYCTTGGLNSSADFIDLVWLGSIQNGTWDNNGYADFTYLNTKAVQGATVSGYLSATYGAGTHDEFFRVWIDFNIDGDFNDAGEKVIDTSTTSIGWVSVSFVVPMTAKPGATRMRVSMKNLSAPSPCGSYAAGETEDYGFVIYAALQNTAMYAADVSAKTVVGTHLKLFPNPASGILNIQHNFNTAKPIQVKVFDITGQLVLSQLLTKSTIDISGLMQGTYLIRLIQGNEMETTKLVILR
jgi:hypothetical protein